MIWPTMKGTPDYLSRNIQLLQCIWIRKSQMNNKGDGRPACQAGSEICNQVWESIWILPVEFCKNPWILVIWLCMINWIFMRNCLVSQFCWWESLQEWISCRISDPAKSPVLLTNHCLNMPWTEWSCSKCGDYSDKHT